MENDEKKKLVVKEKSQLQPSVIIAESSPVAVMQMALKGGMSVEEIKSMIELQKEWDAMEAKKAYTIAMAKFKENPPVITKDKVNRQYGSVYTTLGNLVNSSVPQMSRCGLSHKWSVDQEKDITVTCIVTHEKGHGESTSFTAPPDISGAKNPIQQLKSTITYAKAVTFESIMGLASTDSNFDDDGNGAGEGLVYINDDQKSQILDMITHTGSDVERFLKYLKVDSIDTIPEGVFSRAMQALKKKESKQ